MLNLKYFLNHWCIHAPFSQVRLCLSLSILRFESLTIGDHFDMHLGYQLCTIFWKMKQTHKMAFCGVFAGSTVVVNDIICNTTCTQPTLFTRLYIAVIHHCMLQQCSPICDIERKILESHTMFTCQYRE